MRRGYKAFLVGLLLTTLTVTGLPFAAMAAEPLQVELPTVEVKLEGETSAQEEYKIALQAKNPQTDPMPTGDKDVTLTITGEKTAKFPSISYQEPGIYSYTISQIKGSNDQCTYDDTVYDMTVYVTNKKDGTGMESTITVVNAEKLGKKDAEILFTNRYASKAPTPSPSEPAKKADQTTSLFFPKTGDESGIGVWMLLALMALVVLGALLPRKLWERFQ